jgi:nitroreductase
MKVNPTHQPVLDSIGKRYSPYRFEDRPVEDDKILSCLEAARWASSSFNEQPWSWIVAKRQDSDAFAAMVGCLIEPNQAWASTASVLLISVIRTTFRHNSQPNRVALHDLGQAAAHLSLQAAELGLQVHQMAGVNLGVARQRYAIPDGHQPETAIAIGYPDRSEPADENGQKMRDRELDARKRLALGVQVFAGQWGNVAEFV